MKYNFLMSQLTHIEDLKDTEKTKISVVYHEGLKSSCILRICKGRDLSAVCASLRKIRNPNTVVIHDYVYENGDTYILEENVDGSTVSEIMEDKGLFDEERTAKIIIEICKALEQLHHETPPVIHNDINPSNIKIREDGSVKLYDFDISRIYKKGQNQNTTLFGTEEFAAPEHYGYGQSEPRTDIYCLGVTMHKMLTGNGLSDEHRITYTGKLKSIIQKCLEFDPKHRYASVLALRKDLEKIMASKTRLIYMVLGGLLAAIAVCALILGITKLRGNGYTAETETEASSVEWTNANTDTSETAAPTEPILNNTKELAWTITPGQNQSGSFGKDEAKWYQFTTEADASAYRLQATVQDQSAYTYLRMALFRADGIQCEELLVHRSENDGFLDVRLEPSTEYFLKVYGTDLGSTSEGGSYEICVSKKASDAGIDKEHAAELILGEQYSATLNSTLSDWYVFKALDEGTYRVSLYNLDVGCDIYISLTRQGSAGEGMSVSNMYSWVFSLNKGDYAYFEIFSYGKNPAANGTYILVIEKE